MPPETAAENVRVSPGFRNTSKSLSETKMLPTLFKVKVANNVPPLTVVPATSLDTTEFGLTETKEGVPPTVAFFLTCTVTGCDPSAAKEMPFSFDGTLFVFELKVVELLILTILV